MNEQRDLALKLLTTGFVRFNHEPEDKWHMIVAVGFDGMVELMDMSGRFAPHLFVNVEPPPRILENAPAPST